jgi:predicted DNA-binding transcriptional regulator YafY
MRVSRLLTLVGLLKARGSMTADELAGELGVSRRTVYRDVEVLASNGVALESAHGRAGGYRIARRERPEMLGMGAAATESAALARALGEDRRFAAIAPAAVEAAARAVREERRVTVESADGTRRDLEALGLLHDGAAWQLLARERGELVAVEIAADLAVEVTDRHHSGAPGFDALAAWQSLLPAATR